MDRTRDRSTESREAMIRQLVRGVAPSVAAAAGAAALLAPAAAADTSHVVVEGDTLLGIAADSGTEVDELAAANGRTASSWVYVGEELTVPSPSAAGSSASSSAAAGAAGAGAAGAGASASSADAAAGSAAAASSSASTDPSSVTIAEGDTVSAVAERHGVSVDDLLSANGLGWTSIIYPGQVLSLPLPEVELDPVLLTVGELDAPMTENAQLIISIGREVGAPDRAIEIALATAMQESGLRNLDHGDRDSVGLFQQRPSTGWGTVEQIQDRRHSILAFYGGESSPTRGSAPGLFDVKNWAAMPLTVAAQTVQLSAHPDAYARWESSAAGWLAALR